MHFKLSIDIIKCVFEKITQIIVWKKDLESNDYVETKDKLRHYSA